MSDGPRELTKVDPETKRTIWRLDRELKKARKYGVRATREMHKVLLEDVRRAERRALEAEKRADAAERELAAVRSSSTWRAGRIFVGVPARIKTGLIKYGRKS